MKNLILGLATMCVMLMGCTKEPIEIVDGMAPIYGNWDDISHIKSVNPRAFVNAGKIVSWGNFIFINEINKGIHVIDNTDPHNPVNVAFWVINGNKEFTVKDNVLYADNGRHIFVIDISSFQQIVVLETIKDIYNPSLLEEYPPNFRGSFECYKHTKGPLIGWESTKLTNPKCSAF